MMTMIEHPLGAAASRRRRHADQMLRAAAPDMLATLKDFALWLTAPDLSAATLEEMRAKASAAISKAEGKG